MEVHNYAVGDIVYVLNQTISGRLFLEGRAKIKRLLHNKDRYVVQFLSARDGKPSKQCYERYVDPNAQDEPIDFVEQLNAKVSREDERG